MKEKIELILGHGVIQVVERIRSQEMTEKEKIESGVTGFGMQTFWSRCGSLGRTRSVGKCPYKFKPSE